MLAIRSFLMTAAHQQAVCTHHHAWQLFSTSRTGTHTIHSGGVADPNYCREGCLFLASRASVACAPSADLTVEMGQQLLTLLAMST